jgi:protein TonB
MEVMNLLRNAGYLKIALVGLDGRASAMNAFALHEVSDQAAVRRWGASAFAIAAAHAALIALAMNWYTQRPVPGRLAACDHGRHGAGFLRAAADANGSRAGTRDAAGRCLAAGAGAAEAVQEQIAPTPPQEKPEVVAPPEQKLEMKPATEPAKPVPEPSRRRSSQKSFARREEADRAPPAPRTRPRPAPSARRRPRPPPAPAHRPRRLPPNADGRRPSACASSNTRRPPSRGQQGPRSAFTLSRSGGASQPLGGSSGHSALDAETLAMVRRAQPFPAFPPEITQGSMSFTIPGGVRDSRGHYSFTAPVSDDT